MSPPMVRSMPSSPSRVAYSAGGAARGQGAGLADPGTSMLPREALSGSGRAGALCTNSSAILQRRDVKPDEDVGSSNSMALVVRGEGAHYADSCCSSLLDGVGGRLSMASSQCSGPPSLAGDMVDAGTAAIPGGLQQYRASIKPLAGYGENQTCSLHRQKNRKYGDSQLPSLGTKTPPASPHRAGEVRLTEGQIIGGVGLVTSDRMSPMRRSLRRDSNGATVEVVSRSRGSSSSTSSVFVDSPLGQADRHFQTLGTPSSSQRSPQFNFAAEGGAAGERMKAMEEQIASLAGLVHHALSMGPDAPGGKEAVSESPAKLHSKKLGGPPEPQDPQTHLSPLSPPLDSGLQQRLVSAKRNVCELREQLNQLKHLQLSNQKSVSSMLRMAGEELLGLMWERLSQSEEAAYGQRAQMEEERTKYLNTEEQILTQLSELENYVDSLQRSSSSSPSPTSLTLRDVEEGAVNLRRIGESLSVLKGEFPDLQLKMRSLLRLEVEAVRFLKEEPHKMDSMLKRVKALTETLSSLRRHVSESVPTARVQDPDQQGLDTRSTQSSPKPQPRSSVRVPLSGSQAEVGSASPVMSRRKKSSVVPPSQHYPSPPLTPTHGRDSPSVAKVSPRSRESSPALQRRGEPPQSDPELCILTASPHSTITERQNPEGSLRAEPSTSQTSRSTSTSTIADLDQVLQKAQESLMKSIPNLEVSDPTESRSESVSGQNPTAAPMPKAEQETPPSLAPHEQQARLSNAQQNSSPKLGDEVDATILKVTDTVGSMKPSPSALPSAPPSVSPVLERRPQVEKPRRSSLDKEMKQSLEKASKSPPPPPPRRSHAVSSGRTGEMVLATRTEPVGAQDEAKAKEPPAVPQPKPPRQPPEIKPKPQMCAALLAAASTSSPATSPMPRQQRQEEDEEEDEEEEEDRKFMKELQAKIKGLNASRSSGGNDRKAELKVWKPSTNLHDLTTSDNRSTPQMTRTNGSTVTLPAVPPDYAESRKNKVKLSENTPEDKVVKQGLRSDFAPPQATQETPTSPQKKTMETELPKVSVSLAEMDQTITSPKQAVEQVLSPSATEKKIKYTTIVTLQKENPQEPATIPKQEHEKHFKEALTEKKSNMTVVVTLQKDKASEDTDVTSSEPSSVVQENKSVSFPQESSSVQKVLPSSPHIYSSSLQNQEAPVEVSTNESLNPEEGGTLSPTGCDDEGPPPPPPSIGKFRLSKSKKKTHPKEGDQAKTNGYGLQSGGINGASDTAGHENPGFEDMDAHMDEFDNKPIIVILNEPMDIQSAYKRLSTIFESEEDFEALLSESIMDEDDSILEEDGQEVRTIRLDGNGQSSPQIRQITSSADDTSSPGGQDKTGSPQKSETKRKFKFKFPKNKLAALGLSLRAGSNKSEKKTLEVVVYEEEEETGSIIKSPTKKHTKEAKSSEIINRKPSNGDKTNANSRDIKASPTKSHIRVDELRKNTFDSIQSLEESIKQLEVSVDSIKAASPPPSAGTSPPQSPNSSLEDTDRSQHKGKAKKDRERSPSKRPATQILKGPNPPQSKRAKSQPALDTGKSSSRKQTSSSSSSSSALRSHTKSRHSSSSGSPEKSSKGQQPASQKQPSQPRIVTVPR
ncbi:unnamed protein product [Ophioblennius macclurei]